LSGKLKIIPVSRSMKINLVPVDYVADAVVKLTFDSRAVNKTFHLTAPVESLPTLEELIEFVKEWSKENLNVRFSNPIYMPLNISLLQKISSHGHLFRKGSDKLLETVNTLSPYFNENREYLRDNTKEIIGPYRYKWQNFLPKLIEFAVYHGFLHRSDRTVHEQALFRLQRSSRPVKYYDIVKGEIKESSSTDIYQNIISASKALQSMGVNKGDKVAVAGYNSTKYLILDIAIGIVGAVSVPIYYTSPLNEIKEILDDSSARILFAGTPQILNDLNEFDAHISVVSLCKQSVDRDLEVISWEDFLKKGEEVNKVIDVHLNFDDTATIRYTSGTTGKPRGVMFTHWNLRWMAEFIASMPPWKDRTSEISYLSFLPMNHVVEGIMGTYAPYYAPASLNLYFLENFHDLEESLQKVRPNVFFSVPRFYEKVWCNVLESRIGQIYISSSGIMKTVLGKLIKREILKKVGLDRCAQLIVGSAPVSDELLKCYHELGIEVHNAYGLTEAPLITINRIGKNRIGTVGEPLPDTYIKIDGDGEILINGPQVMSGYFKDDSDSLEDGWLHTGDLGYETHEDSLVITGRRKEVLVNSYGKTISPLKIEVMLKNISGIEEVMVIGDGKPYCSAFLWAEADSNLKWIDKTIGEINTRLSRPEEIKKWVILKDDLSIGTDLTANLKLKRKSISKRYEDIINFIYGSGTKPDSILHFGSIEVDS
ncbi:MAG: AMP-binding protein, partial [Methanobacterium sp.]